MNRTHAFPGLLTLSVGSSLCGCASADPDWREEAVESTGEALSASLVFKQTSDNDGQVSAVCPSDKPFALGGGGEVPAGVGFQTLAPGLSAPPKWMEVKSGVTGPIVRATAVCSDVPGQLWVAASSPSGDRTVTCPSGSVAVGGGATCTGGGRLFRARSNPDSDGSKPTGWRTTCTSGAITSYAICAKESDGFNTCRTERVDGTGTATVNCPANRTAVSAGGYCGLTPSGFRAPLFSLKLDANLRWAKAHCTGSTGPVHAYAVCC